MNTDEIIVWGIHSMDDALFLNKSIVGLAWDSFGDLTKIDNDRDAFKEHYAEVYPDAKKGKINTSVGMLYRFLNEVEVGDYVVFPSKVDRKINIGIIQGDYYFDDNDEWCLHRRKVKWLKHIPRTAFSQGALYEAGSAMTFFMVKNYADEYLAALEKNFKANDNNDGGEDETVGATAEEIKEATKDFIIKELSRQLKGYDLEDFVADLLEAMGYKAEVSPHGGDSGIDIIAYRDELPPRILVQVKSGDNNIRETTIQSLKGAMREGDYGLFVTLADYTKNALKYLESVPIIKGINGSELVDLILDNYGHLSDKYKRMIPLEMVYIPVPRE